MVGDIDDAGLRGYLSRLLDRSVTSHELIVLRSVHKAALASWARKNGVALRPDLLMSRAPFTLQALLGGGGEPVETARAARSPVGQAQDRTGSVVLGMGVDIEEVASLPQPDDYRADPFFQDHFSPGEIAYCLQQADVAGAFCGTWAAKEAVLKSGVVPRSVERLLDIEITRDALGRPGHPGCQVSISHTRTAAVAVCLWTADPVTAAVPLPPPVTRTQAAQPSLIGRWAMAAGVVAVAGVAAFLLHAA